MPRILSLSLRPRTLSGLFGQEELVKSIRNLQKTRQPRAWLFHGSSGTGKTTTARIMAVAYNCQHMALWGDPCKECWDRQTDFAIHEINASETSGVEEMGKVAEISRFRPVGSLKRVIILDEAQRASTAGQNLLLKPTEESPPSTVWIICTTEPSKILATLRRRCTTYQLRSLGFAEREKFLQKAAGVVKIERPLSDLYEQVHLANIGSPALLLQALDKYATGVSAEEAVAGADGVGANSLRICKAVTSGNWKNLRENLLAATPDEARWIRSSVSGWLRGILAKDNSPKTQERAAQSLYDLMANAPIDDAGMLLWLWPVLYKICKRYREA